MKKILLVTLLVSFLLGSLSALVAFREPLAELVGFRLAGSNGLAGPALPTTPPSDDAMDTTGVGAVPETPPPRNARDLRRVADLCGCSASKAGRLARLADLEMTRYASRRRFRNNLLMGRIAE